MRSLLPFFSRSRQDSEWLGARSRTSHDGAEGALILQPSVDLWLELPSGKLVGIKPIDPRTPGSFAEGLKETMANPAEGPQRKPACIRVPSAELAESLRTAFGKEIEIRVALVPELDEVVASLSEHLQTVGEEPAYLDGDMASSGLRGARKASGARSVRARLRWVSRSAGLRG